MKSESNFRPNKFEIENRVQNKCDIVFFDNIQELEPAEDGEKRYSFDIYRLATNDREDLESELNDNAEKYQAWLELAKKTEYDKLAQEIRSKRDDLLNKSDWTQMQDTSLSKEMVKKYQKYRQALRDITKQERFPYEVEFPILYLESFLTVDESTEEVSQEETQNPV